MIEPLELDYLEPDMNYLKIENKINELIENQNRLEQIIEKYTGELP